MKIIVCIKQVPGSSKVDIDEDTGVMKRSSAESKMNPYDLYAIETALRLKEKFGAEITAVTMGPPQAEEVIREAFTLGADKGYLFSDRRFSGADVLATSYTLSSGIRMLGDFDLIICGRQTTDGDTAQVGPAIAEYLSIPHVAWIRAIDHVAVDHMVIQQDLSDYSQTIRLPYPALISVEKDIYQPRLPSLKKKMELKNCNIEVMNLDSFHDQSEENYGLKGSATKVERTFPPALNDIREEIEGPVDTVCNKIYELLQERRFV